MKTIYKIEGIKKENELLSKEVVSRAAKLKEFSRLTLENRPDDFNQIVKRVENFIVSLEDFSSQIERIPVDKFNWLNETAIKWQYILSSIFNIRRDIVISQPKHVDFPSVERRNISSKVPFTENELKEWIKIKSYDLSKDRRLAFLDEKLQEYGGFLNFILREIITSSEDERLLDNYTARVFLASEILDGKINFVHQIPSECYSWSLENTWIKEVKKLKAYYSSKDRENACDTIVQEDYHKACEQIRQALMGSLNPDVKACSEDFIEIKKYIENNYLTKGKIDPYDSERGGKLISRKAEHISKNTYHLRKHDESFVSFNYRNWRWAETFVKNFYENIIEAVENNDVNKASKVLSSFQIKEVFPEEFKILPEDHDLITNCFEAAIAIYFLSPALLNKCQEESRLANIFI